MSSTDPYGRAELSEGRLVRFGLTFVAVAVVMVVLGIASDDTTGRVIGFVAALVALAMAAMAPVALLRLRRARRDPDSAEARRLDEFARTLPPAPSRRERAVGLSLLGAFAVLLLLDRGVELSAPLAVVVDVALVVVVVAMLATTTVQLVRSRRWRRERSRQA